VSEIPTRVSHRRGGRVIGREPSVPGEGAAPGWGTLLDAASHSGLAGPDRDRQAQQIYTLAVKEMSGRIAGLAPILQANPEEPPHPRRQIEGGPGRASALRPGSAIRRMPGGPRPAEAGLVFARSRIPSADLVRRPEAVGS
jgi:hypothetical protein